MASTNFAALTADQKLVWSRKLWQDARDAMFINRFMGTEQSSIIQRITELTKTEKGTEAIIHLVADLVGDGVQGDNAREGAEEAMQSYNEKIQLDLISHGVKNTGKLSDQKTVIDFRTQSRDKLAYWLANRMDQLAFLTLAGIAYSFTNNGAARVDPTFPALSFAADVSAPSANRHLRVDGAGLSAGNTALLTATDTLTYAHIVDIMTEAKVRYIKPLMSGGKEFYMAFVRPEVLAQLKKDPDYQRAVVTGLPREMNNPFFSGAITTVDGLVIHDHRLVYNTKGAVAPNKWGAAGDVDGTRVSVCGSQALGMVDLGAPEWAEEDFEYKSQYGINIDKMFGFVKPKFGDIYSGGAVEDFGVLTVDVAI